MTEKEKQLQEALGTMKRQMFVSADWKDTDGLLNEIKKALENFGLFMYDDPGFEGTDSYGFIISNERLTDTRVKEMGLSWDGEEDEE